MELEGIDINEVLPSQWKFEIMKVISFGKSPLKYDIKFKVALFSEDDIKLWIQDLEYKARCRYSIRSTEKCSGQRVRFKQRLFCQYNTRCKTQYEDISKIRTKNTNCPSSLNITLQTIRKVFRGKAHNAPDPEMPCVIDYVVSHNHDLPEHALEFDAEEGVKDGPKIELIILQGPPDSALENFIHIIDLPTENYDNVNENYDESSNENYKNMNGSYENISENYDSIHESCENIDEGCENIDEGCENMSRNCENISQNCENISQNCEKFSQNCEKFSQNCENISQNCDNIGQNCENISENYENINENNENTNDNYGNIEDYDNMNGNFEQINECYEQINENFILINENCDKMEEIYEKINGTCGKMDQRFAESIDSFETKNPNSEENFAKMNQNAQNNDSETLDNNKKINNTQTHVKKNHNQGKINEKLDNYNQINLESYETNLNQIINGQKLINEMSELFNEYLQQFPMELFPALTQMVGKIKKLRTVKALVSSCSKFALEPLVTARRKHLISEKRRRTSIRSRKNVKFKKRFSVKSARKIEDGLNK